MGKEEIAGPSIARLLERTGGMDPLIRAAIPNTKPLLVAKEPDVIAAFGNAGLQNITCRFLLGTNHTFFAPNKEPKPRSRLRR
jgi:hypothetical protein